MPNPNAPFPLFSPLHLTLPLSKTSTDLLENHLFPHYFPRCRWFGGKNSPPLQFKISATIPLHDSLLTLVDVSFPSSPTQTYLLPLKLIAHPPTDPLPPSSIIAESSSGHLLFDSLADPAFRTALFHLIAHSQIIPSPSGPILGLPGNPLGSTSHSVLLATEQSNSAILYDQQIFLKVFRRLQPGINPDAEILQFLAQRHFPQVPAYSGSIEFHSTSTPTSTPIVLALAMAVVPKKSDAWDWARLQLTQQLHAVIANDSTTAEKIQTHFLQRSHQLGAATGQLHLALASDPHNPHFSPEPLTPTDLLELSTELLQTTSNLLLQLPQQLPHLDPTSRSLALSLLENPSPLLLKIHSLSSHPIATTKFRTHGDFHLGQVLDTGNQFVIIDFEGEPQRSITQRRRKQSPVRDLAGLCRSLDYAAQSVLQDFPASHPLLPPIVNRWRDLASHAFLQGWSQTVAPAPFAPSPENLAWLLHSFLLEKALYEVSYELHHRPAWLPIPLNGLLQLLSIPT